MSREPALERTDSPEQLYCGSCGAIIPEGKHFCPQCLAPAAKGIRGPVGEEPSRPRQPDESLEADASGTSAFEEAAPVGPEAALAAEQHAPMGTPMPLAGEAYAPSEPEEASLSLEERSTPEPGRGPSAEEQVLSKPTASLPEWLVPLAEDEAEEKPVSPAQLEAPEVPAPPAASPQRAPPVEVQAAPVSRSTVVKPASPRASRTAPAPKRESRPARKARPARRVVPSLRWLWLLIAVAAAVQVLFLFCSLEFFAWGGQPQKFADGLCCCLGPQVLVAALGVCALFAYRTRR